MGQGGSNFDTSFVSTWEGDFTKRYQIQSKLGEGAQGTVYLVTRFVDGKELVAKETHDMSPEGMRQFEDEFNKLRDFAHHPNIVQVEELVKCQSLASGKRIDQCFVISELAKGGDLYGLMRNRIQHNLGMSEGWVAGVCKQAMAGVSFLHSKDLKHSDLKLDNILVIDEFKVDSTTPPRVVISDFGCATLAKDQKCQCGDPRYASPETWHVISKIQEGRPVNSRDLPGLDADIWAMGVVFFELMSGGILPFVYKEMTLDEAVDDSDEVKDAVLKPDVLQVREHCIGCSDEFVLLLNRMFERNVASRPRAKDVCSDAWFTVQGNAFDTSVLQKLKVNTLKSQGHAILMNALVSRLQRDHTAACREVFEQADINKDGTIDFEEFEEAYGTLLAKVANTSAAISRTPSSALPGTPVTPVSNLEADPASSLSTPVVTCRDNAGTCHMYSITGYCKGCGLSKQELRDLFKEADVDNDGTLDFSEFVAITFDWSAFDRTSMDTTLDLLFNFLDTDSNGEISTEELQAVFRGSKLTRDEIKFTFEEIDGNHDNKITKDELKAFLMDKGKTRAKVPVVDAGAKCCCSAVALSMVAGVIVEIMAKYGVFAACL